MTPAQQAAKVANRHPCKGGCGILVNGLRDYCPSCGVRKAMDRLNALKRRRRRERRR